MNKHRKKFGPQRNIYNAPRALPVFSVIDNWTKSKFGLFLLRLDQMFPPNKNGFALSNSNK